MNTSLPSPTTQAGLLGYWVLSDLTNQQGNAAYDGRIEGLATIGQTNSTCGFIADSCNIVLPVRITDFNASVFEKREIKLSWNTAGESGIGSYTIQRGESSDFRNAVNLGTVNSANNGTTNLYTFSDNSLLKNKLYFYRLKINEKTGVTTWSDIKSGKISANSLAVDFYPNPTKNGLVNLRFNDITGNATITVTSNTGQVLMSKKVLASSVR